MHFVEHFHPLTVALLDWLAARLKGAVDSCLRFTTHSSAGPFLGPPYQKRQRLCFGRFKGMTLLHSICFETNLASKLFPQHNAWYIVGIGTGCCTGVSSQIGT